MAVFMLLGSCLIKIMRLGAYGSSKTTIVVNVVFLVFSDLWIKLCVLLHCSPVVYFAQCNLFSWQIIYY